MTHSSPTRRSSALALPVGASHELLATEIHTVPIHDLRPLAESLSLDREGFVLRHAPTAVADLYDDVAVETAYYAEIEALVKRELGANRVVLFDDTRRSDEIGRASGGERVGQIVSIAGVGIYVTKKNKKLKN